MSLPITITPIPARPSTGASRTSAGSAEDFAAAFRDAATPDAVLGSDVEAPGADRAPGGSSSDLLSADALVAAGAGLPLLAGISGQENASRAPLTLAAETHAAGSGDSAGGLDELSGASTLQPAGSGLSRDSALPPEFTLGQDSLADGDLSEGQAQTVAPGAGEPQVSGSAQGQDAAQAAGSMRISTAAPVTGAVPADGAVMADGIGPADTTAPAGATVQADGAVPTARTGAAPAGGEQTGSDAHENHGLRQPNGLGSTSAAGVSGTAGAAGASGVSSTQPATVSPTAPATAAAPTAVPGAAEAQGTVQASAPSQAAADTQSSIAGPAIAVAAPVASAPVTAASAAEPAATAGARPALLPQLAAPVIALARSPQGEHSVTLTVSPENLGPVTVRAHIVGSSIRLELHAPSDAGREALRVILADLRRDLSVAAPGASVDVSARDTPSGSTADAQARSDSQGRSDPQNRTDAQARGDQSRARPDADAGVSRRASGPVSVADIRPPAAHPSSSHSRIDVYA